MSTTPSYIPAGSVQFPFTVRWDQSSGEMHLATSDPQFTDENGEKHGLLATFSPNPRSANYHPSNFNRCVRALRAAGKPAPDEVPVYPRELKKRGEVTAALGARAEGPKAADATQFGWMVCPVCAAVVTSEVKHIAAAHPEGQEVA